ncbi:MAG TPA: hypothetical protein DIT13_01730 [Verrucomicrobiales bacterium]|nr:hypothetical protein [Verrucomicrobiales bacterium]HRJ07516.1 hypothetical protein [Prosthecobacter sp.]HRK12762.1 hypothetical protein [Prosthecobacter sp.]
MNSRAILSAALLLTASVLQTTAAEPKVVRVEFKPGATSAAIKGSITGEEFILYKLNARDGQYLSVSLQASTPSADFNIYIPGRGPGDDALFASAMAPEKKYSGQLYKTGDHSISVFLNRNAARKGVTAKFDILFKITATPPDATTDAPVDDTAGFSQQASYGKMSFKVTSPAKESGNSFTLTPSGLSASNEPVTVPIKGFVVNLLCDDIDGDDSPEIAVITQDGPQERGTAHVFSTNAKKSMSAVNLRDITDTPKLINGYGGGDEYQFVEGTFIRRFPIQGDGAPTGKTRQLQYKLKPGEAMKQLVLDKSVEY